MANLIYLQGMETAEGLKALEPMARRAVESCTLEEQLQYAIAWERLKKERAHNIDGGHDTVEVMIDYDKTIEMKLEELGSETDGPPEAA